MILRIPAPIDEGESVDFRELPDVAGRQRAEILQCQGGNQKIAGVNWRRACERSRFQFSKQPCLLVRQRQARELPVKVPDSPDVAFGTLGVASPVEEFRRRNGRETV